MTRLFATLTILVLFPAGPAAPAAPEAAMEPPPDAEAVVRTLYDLVTFDEQETPDWDVVRGLFLEEAVVVLRTSREASTVFSVDGFIQDFVTFAGKVHERGSGFTETIVRMQTMEFGDIAHALVLYEAHVTASERPPQRGVDSIQLVRADGAWKIASITNELPAEGRPLPGPLRD